MKTKLPASRKGPGRSMPRDPDAGDASKDSPPAAVDRNPLDEDYADAGKPLVAGSPEARALQRRPPSARGELGVGTAGDAARPTKAGIHDKPIPPRGKM